MDKIFKAMADKNRRQILSLLRGADMNVSEILKNFNFTQATLSSHLALLRKAKLVDCRVNGRERIYFLNKELFERFVEELNKFIDKPLVSIKPTEEIKLRGSR